MIRRRQKLEQKDGGLVRETDFVDLLYPFRVTEWIYIGPYGVLQRFIILVDSLDDSIANHLCTTQEHVSFSSFATWLKYSYEACLQKGKVTFRWKSAVVTLFSLYLYNLHRLEK